MRTEDLAQYERLLRWAAVPLGIMVASVAGFVLSFFGTGRKWLAFTAVGLNVLGQIANLVTEVPSVRHAEAIRQVEAFGGGRFTFPVIVNGPWNVVDFVSVVMLLAFILDASIAEPLQSAHRGIGASFSMARATN
jgi:two-component system sensor kinase FixL